MTQEYVPQVVYGQLTSDGAVAPGVWDPYKQYVLPVEVIQVLEQYAIIDNTGQISSSRLPDVSSISEAIADLAETVADIETFPGAAGKTLLVGEFDTPASGNVSQMFYLPEAVTHVFAPAVQADVAPVGGAVSLDIEVDSGLGFSTILSGNVSLNAGQSWVVGATPAVQSLPAGSRMRMKVLSAPVTVTSTLARVPNVATTNTTTNAVTSVTMTKPSGAVDGALLIAFIGRQGPTITLPSGWNVLAEIQSDPTTVQARMTVAWAINSSSLGMNVTLSLGTPVLTHVLAFNGFDVSQPFSSPSTFGQNNQGKTITLPAYTTGDSVLVEPDEYVIWAALSRYVAADDGRVHTWSGTGVGSIADAGTTRGSTNTDIRMSVAALTAPVVTDGVTVVLPTVGDAAGSDFTSWCSIVLGVRQGLSSGSAGRLTCQIMVR